MEKQGNMTVDIIDITLRIRYFRMLLDLIN